MFDELANTLLNQTTLLINGLRCHLREVEFYLYSQDHPDPYAHRHPEQHTTYGWYFHRPSSKSTKYKEGTRKGLDVTFGNEGSAFGVLIRSIELPNGVVVSGPCRVVEFILEAYKCETIASFTGGEVLSCRGNKWNFLLCSDTPRSMRVWKGPRIGLGNSRPEFFQREYRYATNPETLTYKERAKRGGFQ